MASSILMQVTALEEFAIRNSLIRNLVLENAWRRSATPNKNYAHEKISLMKLLLLPVCKW